MICDKTTKCFSELLKGETTVSCRGVSKCLHFCDKRRNAKCDEKGKSYMLENIHGAYKIMSIRIDDGVVIVDKNTPAGLSKCDYLFLIDVDKAPIAILIELKGKDINHAVEQIDSTLDILSDYLKTCDSVHGRIVFSGGTPNIQKTPKFMKVQKRLKRMSGTLQAREKHFSEKIGSIIG